MRSCIVKWITTLALLAAASAHAVERPPPQFATSTDGAKIAYYASKATAGTPLLVLSGGPGTDSRYMQVGGALDELAKSRQVIFFDQRGTAASAAANGSETIAKYVEDIEAVRKAAGAKRVSLLGHSFGGYLAIAYTAKHPDKVQALVLADSAPPKLSDLKCLLATMYPDRIEAWRTKRATLADNNKSSESAIFMSMEFVSDRAYRDYLSVVADHRDNIVVNNTLRKDMDKLDYWPQVRAFKLPTLILHGRFDAVVASENGWQLHQAIPGSRFHVIERAGHLPHAEQPKEFLAAVAEFLNQAEGGRP